MIEIPVVSGRFQRIYPAGEKDCRKSQTIAGACTYRIEAAAHPLAASRRGRIAANSDKCSRPFLK
jgi:hypothetical protein